jgi:NADH-quinone oxidoreductase subunit F
VRDAPGDRRYVVCNGDEGDPGAFMDRMLLESYPYRIIEGLAIAARAVGASEAILYVRHEYPLAVKRLREALARCEAQGLLGDRLFGSDFSLSVSLLEGAGAFVCGEETGLLASLEGRRGMPRLRPPYPAQRGYQDLPTCVNNVETLALVPWIIRRGPAAFRAHGTERSPGTKVFSLTGKTRRGGLIEVPMGITIRQIVEEIGGGVAEGRTFKAVQIGGPSGGCIPARLADTPVDYEALTGAGAIMGSGGLVVMDDLDCMVDVARYFLEFTQRESCGKCTFCRIGTRRMLDLLEAICTGHGKPADLDELEELGRMIKRGSLCGLGQTAPNPVLTTLRYFRDEYEAHLRKQCPAGRCKALLTYSITEACIGCTRCAQNCPADAIAMKPYERHLIDLRKCIKCGTCKQICPVDAVKVS